MTFFVKSPGNVPRTFFIEGVSLFFELTECLIHKGEEYLNIIGCVRLNTCRSGNITDEMPGWPVIVEWMTLLLGQTCPIV